MKKRNALKFISLVLSILMVLAVFASCSNNEEHLLKTDQLHLYKQFTFLQMT